MGAKINRSALRCALALIIPAASLLCVALADSAESAADFGQPATATLRLNAAQQVPFERLTPADAADAAIDALNPNGADNRLAINYFHSQCYLRRASIVRSDPTLYFYSARTHSRATYGCSRDVVLELAQAGAFELDLDELGLRTDLVESGLYEPRQVTYFILHGFRSSWNKNAWLCDTKDMILNSSDANVFLVDWSGGARPSFVGDYGAAVASTGLVAELLASFIDALMRASNQTDASRFHLIGHSLGAHIAGYIGYSLPKLGRITALDPAGPCFTNATATAPSRSQVGRASRAAHPNIGAAGDIGFGRRRLSPASAKLVVALHTDIAVFGLRENVAHYDVYVNGGYRQAQCGTWDLISRANDLFDLNARVLLSPSLVCAHSFAHELLDTFAATFGGARAQQARPRLATEPPVSSNYRQLVRPDLSDDERCYPMAIACDSWQAYLLGECGPCDSNNDPNCIYTSLTFDPNSLPPPAPFQVDPRAPRLADKSRNDDNTFNDEDDSIAAHANPFLPDDSQTYGRHFMKSGPRSPVTCLYQYQLVVATERAADEAAAAAATPAYFYLHIPLDTTGRFGAGDGHSGEPVRGRLAQVSHKLRPGSRAFASAARRLAAALGPHTPTDAGRSLNLYTALITFAVAPASACANASRSGGGGGVDDSDRWQLCRPLGPLLELQVWARSEPHVGAVRFAAINYMSGLDVETRERHSRAFVRAHAQQVYSREQVEAEFGAVAGLSELSPRGLIQSSFKSGATRGLKCLFSLFNPYSAATSFKCARSSSYLSHAVLMRPAQ